MKQVLLIVLLILPTSLYAQEQVANRNSNANNTILSGKHWKMSIRGSMDPTKYNIWSYEDAELRGDTVISGIRFKELYKKTWTDGDNDQPFVFTRIYFGEENGKIYKYNSLLNTISVVFDFTLKEGDTFQTSEMEMFGEKAVVSAVSETILNGSTDKTPRKCLYISWYGEVIDIWVEGVGSLTNGLYGMDDGYFSWGCVMQLMICYKDNEVLYEYENMTDRIEQPVSLEGKGQIYDLQGRRVVSPQRGGLYIRDGRKFILR